MNDIATGEDIRALVDAFYRQLTNDDVVGHFFTGLDLDHHLPRIAAFWEMALLGKAGYTTNVTDVHLALNKRIPMERVHFDRWLQLFNAVIDERFNGPIADEAKSRAASIALVMLVKIQRA